MGRVLDDCQDGERVKGRLGERGEKSGPRARVRWRWIRWNQERFEEAEKEKKGQREPRTQRLVDEIFVSLPRGRQTGIL